MSDAEKELRGHLARAPAAMEMLHALLAEHRAALSRARAEVLEEAAKVCDARADLMRADGERTGPTYVEGDARRIRALITTPAPATIPVERVREVLDKAAATLGRQGCGSGIVRDIARGLGVDLDAQGEAQAAPDLVRQAQGSYPAPGVHLTRIVACPHGRVWPEQCPECSS